MMITEKSWKVPAALRFGIVAMAFCILPLGLVYAQDFKAVERRLGGAVEEGELTLEQALVMMEALKRSAGSERGPYWEMESRKRRYMAFAKEIEAAVDAGKISKEDAEKKLIELREKMFGDASQKKKNWNDKDERIDYYRKAEAELKELVEAGKITREQSNERLGRLKKRLWNDKGEDREIEAKKRRYMAFAKEIEAAVDAGKISKEDAEKKLFELRKKMFRNGGRKKEARRDQRGISVEEYRRGEAQIRELVKKGKVSKEDAEKRLIEMRKAIRSEEPDSEKSEVKPEEPAEKPEGDDNRSRKPTKRDRR